MLQQSSPVQVRCFEMSQLLCGMFPIFPVFEEESAMATRASAGSPRWTQRCAIKSCITGCRDDRGVRGCLSHHHTCCSFVPLWLSLLFCFILSHLLSRSVSCPVFFSLVLSLNQSCCFSPPKNIFFTFSSPLSFTRLSSSSPLLFLAGGAVNTLVYASTFAFSTTVSGLWLDFLHFSPNEWQRFSLSCLTLSLLLTQALASFTGWNARTQCSLASWHVLQKIQLQRLFSVREIMAHVRMLCAWAVFRSTLVMIILPVTRPSLTLDGKIMQWMKAGPSVSKAMYFGFIY